MTGGRHFSKLGAYIYIPKGMSDTCKGEAIHADKLDMISVSSSLLIDGLCMFESLGATFLFLLSLTIPRRVSSAAAHPFLGFIIIIIIVAIIGVANSPSNTIPTFAVRAHLLVL